MVTADGGGGDPDGSASRHDVRSRVAARLRVWFESPLEAIDEARWEDAALRIFRLQFEGNEAYRRFCQGRSRTPDTVERWDEVPLVPTTAFKHLDLYSGPGDPAAIFQTSGTSGGREQRGRHPIGSLGLYRDAAVPWFALNLLPEGGRLPVLALIPGPDRAPHSSLTTMMAFVSEALGTGEGGFFAHPDRGVEAEAFRSALEAVRDAGRPALLMGTAFAWVNWLDRCGREGWRIRLPEGSRLMETGGFKGRSRTVSPDELYRSLSEGLGIPPQRMVNEYGMTELLSQLYEPTLRAATPPGRPGARVHRPPPWLRVRALDPETLAPLPAGRRGLLAFFDPANLDSVSAVLTEDVGAVDDEGVHLSGRAPGAEPRGCSLAMEELLEGVR